MSRYEVATQANIPLPDITYTYNWHAYHNHVCSCGGITVTQRNIIDCPYYLLTRASLATTGMMRRELAAVGWERVRPAYLGVLLCLWLEDGRQAGELGRCAGLEPSTMTGLLDRMERDGLLRRQPDPEDRRAHRIFLTAEGKEAESPVGEVIDSALDRMMADIDDKDVDRCKSILRQILTNAAR